MLLRGRALGPRSPRVLACGWWSPCLCRVARVLRWEVLREDLLLLLLLLVWPPVVPRLVVVLLRAAKTQQQLAGYRRDRPFVRLLFDHNIPSRHSHRDVGGGGLRWWQRRGNSGFARGGRRDLLLSIPHGDRPGRSAGSHLLLMPRAA